MPGRSARSPLIARMCDVNDHCPCVLATHQPAPTGDTVAVASLCSTLLASGLCRRWYQLAYASQQQSTVYPIRSFEQSFTENEVFILPTTKIRAPLLSTVEEDAAFHEFNGLVLRNPRVGNLLDCTSISLPLPVDGLSSG